MKDVSIDYYVQLLTLRGKSGILSPIKGMRGSQQWNTLSGVPAVIDSIAEDGREERTSLIGKQRKMMNMCAKLTSMMGDGLWSPCADSFRREKG